MVQTYNAYAEHKSLGYLLDELEKIREVLFDKLKENPGNNSTIRNNKTYSLEQDENGLLIIKKISYIQPINESVIEALTKNLNELDEVKKLGRGYRIEQKQTSSIAYSLTITFSEEISNDIRNNILMNKPVKQEFNRNKFFVEVKAEGDIKH